MGLRFILGRAGTGKTRHCLEAIRSAALADPQGPPLILLVPEQATFQMEQALLSDGALKGMIRAQVLSFQRLAWRVSLRAGGLSHPPLSDLGKAMVLRALLEARQGELKLFGQVADRPGFIAKLANSISEVRQYRLGPDDLQRQVEKQTGADTTLSLKLHDLAMVMQDLTDYTKGRFTDPDDYLNVLADRLNDSGVLEGAEVWIDGFTGFTPQELYVLQAIFRSARQVHLTLCLDPSELGRKLKRHTEQDLFHPTLSTYEQLQALAAECGIVPDAPLHLTEPHRFGPSRDLAYLEHMLFRPGRPEPWMAVPHHLTITAAQTRRQEVEAAAREVLRLVQHERLRYRDISLVTRNLDAYGDLTATVFAEHDIPVFVDRRRTVAHHPLIELLRAALETVIQDWSYPPVFRYLKTDLTRAGRGEVDALENYVVEHGIRGRAWHDGRRWEFMRRYTLEEDQAATPQLEEMLDRINSIKADATAELAGFQRRVGGGRVRKPLTVKSITTALYTLLDELKVSRRLERWASDAEMLGNLEEAREHVQVWDGVMELLDQMVEALGEAAMTLPQYLQVLSAGLDGLKLGLIPPGMDQVVLGSVERSRHSGGLRATLILGATEKDFPPQPPEDVVFTDRERERLDEGGLELGPTSLARLFQEQFFTYIALTRGSERLYLSYPAADESGRAIAPSPVVGRLRALFPDLPITPAVVDDVAAVATPLQLGAAMVRNLRAHRSGYPLAPVWLDLYQWAATDLELRVALAPVMRSLSYEEFYSRLTAPLGRELALELYGDPLTTSVSRLEAFAACPFQHFAGYGMRLQERAKFELSAPSLGLFYHAALSLFVRQLKEEGRDWADLTPVDVETRLDGLVDQLAPRLQSEILLSSPQHKYMLRVLRRTLQASVRHLSEHAYQGDFRPLWVELPFGEGEEGLPAVQVEVPGGSHVRLRGRIDRVDGLETPEGWLLRVLDYKSSPKSLDMNRFYHGLTLQLLLYLYAVVSNADMLLPGLRRPAGALYFPIHDPITKLEAPEPAEQVKADRRKLYTAKGIVAADPAVIRAMDKAGMGLTQAKINKDGTLRKGVPAAAPEQFDAVFGHLRRTIAQSADRLLQGEVGAKPYKLAGQTPCAMCRFRPVCQFDPAVEGQRYSSLENLKADAVWDLIGKKEEEQR